MQREEEAEKRREQQKAEGRAAARNPAAAATPPRSESPTPAKYRPGAIGGGGTWRDREAKKAAGGVAAAVPLRPASPALMPRSVREELPKDDDGFQAVSEKKVWKPKRFQQGR